MSIDPHSTALMGYLKVKGEVYHGKVLELREAVEGWLNYIPHSFPHYTRHTVHHSDEIVSQVSKLLFKDEDPESHVIKLSAVEAYILIASAYLHDAGMVAADREKIQILSSAEWKEWTSDGAGGSRRWNEIQALRAGKEPADEVLRDFLADLQTRFLIAEFIRRVHHLRAADVIAQHQAPLGRFAFDDAVLQRTIADVCVAHGLRPHELEDQERFPDRRDIRGQAVNVRLVAILLRLGDLLDMSNDRACPLLLNAACPLPADSLAHWTQYQRITHRLTAPDKIEITAECQDQQEHRLLQDWCQWLVDEIRNARVLMSRATRHKGWELPAASLDDPQATISIRPAKTASYFPSKWTFELDTDAIFQRLIYDVYKDPTTFVRELIQNALDANRCQMYLDLVNQGLAPPEYPTQVEAARREGYPVHINLISKEIENPLSEETEKRQVLIVEDCGIGMDKDIITRYFLQVGRSYYITDEFRRSFRFIPTSRFGVGFLSVFAVSDNVLVETYKPGSASQDGSIRLILTGPRNYLLTETGKRLSSGTRIEVLLREPLDEGKLTELVGDWCRRVEFPVIVNDLGTETTVRAETPDQFTYEMPDVTQEGVRISVRSFPVNRNGIEGELYVFVRAGKEGESWSDRLWYQSGYSKSHPQAVRPVFTPDLLCLHGIAFDVADSGYSPISARLDYRRDTMHIPLSRERRISRRDYFGTEIWSRWEEILKEHLVATPLARSKDGWKYKQELIDHFHIPLFWASLPETIPIYRDRALELVCLNSIQDLPLLNVLVRVRGKSKTPVSRMSNSDPTLISDDLANISGRHLRALFANRSVKSAKWLSANQLSLSFAKTEESDWAHKVFGNRFQALSLRDTHCIGFPVENITQYSSLILLNLKHPFVQWIVRYKEIAEKKGEPMKSQFETFMSLLNDTLYGLDLSTLQNYVTRLQSLPDLDPTLRPPKTKLSKEMFIPRRKDRKVSRGV